MHSEPVGEIYCGEKASHDGVNNPLMNFFTNDKLSAVEDCAMFSIGKGVSRSRQTLLWRVLFFYG